MIIFVESPTAKAIEAYKNKTLHRFYQYSHLVLVLFIYELLFLISAHDHVVEYNGIDAWFKVFQQYIPGGTLVFSLILIISRGYYVYIDWFGLWSTQEYKRARDEAKNKKKKISELRKKPLREGGVNWYYWFFIMLEGFVYGSFMRLLLPLITFATVFVLDPDVNIPAQLDAVRSLRYFHTNFIQDISLAFGGGFYDEFIFRGLLLGLLFRVFSKEVNFISQDQLKKGQLNKVVTYKQGSLFKFSNYFLYRGDYTRKLKKLGDRLPVILTAAVIYSFSHFTYYFGDEFTMYNVFYRIFFAITMYYIFGRRRFSVAVWTHVFYDIWYFIFL